MSNSEQTAHEPKPPSSDAETEPLPFDDDADDADDTGAHQTEDHKGTMADQPEAPHPEAHRPEDFSGESDLTEDSESDAGGGTPAEQPAEQPAEHGFSDDSGSPLSEEGAEPAAEGGAEPADSTEPQPQTEQQGAIDGLTALASSDAPFDDGTDAAPSSEEEDKAPAPPEETTRHTPRRGTHSALRRAVVAAAGKRRAAATGGAPSLLVGDQEGDSSAPASAASSRQASPTASETEPAQAESEDHGAKEEEEEGAGAEPAADKEQAAEQGTAEATPEAPGAEEEAAEPHPDDEAEATAAAEEAAVDEAATEAVDAEAMQWRQDAIDQLTRIEIGFAMLRDRLYSERMRELEMESEMIADGSHPELQHLHALIDTRRDRRIALLQTWLEQDEREFDRRGASENPIAWVNWRERAADQRRTMIEDANRKRRKIDREKRLLDVPRPVRRHRPFEAELLRKPLKYARGARRPPHVEQEDIRNFIAYPDLRGLDEYDTWMDMEQMGIRPMPSSYGEYYRPEEMPVSDAYPPYYGDAPPPPEAGGPPSMVPYGNHGANGGGGGPGGMPPAPYVERGMSGGHAYDAPMYMSDEYAPNMPHPGAAAGPPPGAAGAPPHHARMMLEYDTPHYPSKYAEPVYAEDAYARGPAGMPPYGMPPPQERMPPRAPLSHVVRA